MKTDSRSYDPARYRVGEENPAARLTTEQVLEIKALLARGAGYRFLAGRYGVCVNTIGQIARGQTWRHVPWPSPRQKERGR
jgi:hypothetical protein